MKAKNVDVLITNIGMKKMTDGTDYCAIGILTLDDGQKFDVSIRDEALYKGLSAMTKAKVDMDITNSKYGVKLTITKITQGAAI